MGQLDKSSSDRAKYLVGFAVLAAVVLIGISAYFGAKGTDGAPSSPLAGAGNALAAAPLLNGSAKPTVPAALQQPNNSVANGTPAAAQAPNGTAPPAQQNATPAAKKEVVIDFLYADWCGHCQTMKPIVARLEAALPKDRLEVRYWNEASRSDAAVAAVYTTYTDKGYFQGFPTFVANGDDPKVGSMPESTFKAWVCSKFSSPKPTGC
jgi:thiol-disulfide isomerase/thioredoxin